MMLCRWWVAASLERENLVVVSQELVLFLLYGLFVLFEQCLMAVFFVGVSVVTFHFISCLKERFFPMGIDIFI